MSLSASVAVSAAPMSVPAAVFSARLRAAVSEANAGAAFVPSSSLTVTPSVRSARLAYSLAPETAWVRTALSLAASASSAARTVTVRAVAQFVVVKVSAFCTPAAMASVSSTVTSVEPLGVMVTVTPALGRAARRTV